MNLKEILKKGKTFCLSLSLSLSPLSARKRAGLRPFLFLACAQTAQLAQPATPPAQHRLSPFFF
jgi:hypothetical protein